MMNIVLSTPSCIAVDMLTQSNHQVAKSLLWMLGTLLSFCLMAIGARELSGEVSTFQMLFFRSVIGLVAISLLMFATRTTAHVFTRRLRLHGLRNVFHYAGQYGWFVGIGLLPLAEVFALEFTVPLWTAIIAWLFLGEALTKAKLAAIGFGLLGVFIIVKPGYEVVNLASLIVLGAAMCYSISHACTKSLSATEHPFTILFMMCVIQLPIGFVLALPSWQMPVGTQWNWLLLIGVTALSAHFCMTKAMQYADVTSVVIMDFFRLPAIAVVGVFLYNEQFEWSLLLGALLMLLGNVAAMSKLKAGNKIESEITEVRANKTKRK